MRGLVQIGVKEGTYVEEKTASRASVTRKFM
jgi:hypothetical protein